MKDAPRTLGNQAEFRQRVTNEKLVRVLNAWQHDHGSIFFVSFCALSHGKQMRWRMGLRTCKA